MREMQAYEVALASSALAQAVKKVERIMETMPPHSAKRTEWQDKLQCLKDWQRRLEEM